VEVTHLAARDLATIQITVIPVSLILALVALAAVQIGHLQGKAVVVGVLVLILKH
jgi:hypothetical protein